MTQLKCLWRVPRKRAKRRDYQRSRQKMHRLMQDRNGDRRGASNVPEPTRFGKNSRRKKIRALERKKLCGKQLKRGHCVFSNNPQGRTEEEVAATGEPRGRFFRKRRIETVHKKCREKKVSKRSFKYIAHYPTVVQALHLKRLYQREEAHDATTWEARSGQRCFLVPRGSTPEKKPNGKKNADSCELQGPGCRRKTKKEGEIKKASWE